MVSPINLDLAKRSNILIRLHVSQAYITAYQFTRDEDVEAATLRFSCILDSVEESGTASEFYELP